LLLRREYPLGFFRSQRGGPEPSSPIAHPDRGRHSVVNGLSHLSSLCRDDSRFTGLEGPASLSVLDSPAPRAQNDTAHTIFTQQWAIYGRFVDADYMSHRAFFGILHDLVAARTQPFSFLDLASGDACCSVGALAGSAIADYTAVDLCEQALIWGHVSECDYPESPEGFEEIARQAGFSACDRLLIDPYRFYSGFRAIA
jgi:hypothetical protein